ncbi:MAG: GatB/YqeY domain-containing protein [Bacteroidales bacterium]|nr:GatB/YqeY domain-containing protein [Bacteroidales bacterium]
MSYFDLVNEDLKKAMLAKEKDKLEAIRAIKSAFLLARTDKGANSVLEENEEIRILQKLVKQRKDSSAIYLEQNRPELSEKELMEAAIIEKYLPAQMSEDEVSSVVKRIIADSGASGMKDMGKVMGLATKELAGKADGKMVSGIVKQLLA